MSKSIFDKITPEQYDRMNEEMGWWTEPYSPIDDQTVHFWHLQLQFLSINRYSLGCLMLYYQASGLYRNNSKSGKAADLADKARWRDSKFTPEDHECLSTHLALQLAGIEE